MVKGQLGKIRTALYQKMIPEGIPHMSIMPPYPVRSRVYRSDGSTAATVGKFEFIFLRQDRFVIVPVIRSHVTVQRKI
jgi:hypothetical protein